MNPDAVLPPSEPPAGVAPSTSDVPARRRAKKQLNFAAAVQQASNAQADLQRLSSDVGDPTSSVQPIPPIPIYPPLFPRQHAQLHGSDLSFSGTNDPEAPTLRAPPLEHPPYAGASGALPASQMNDESAGGPNSSINHPRRKRKIHDLATAIYEASASDPTFELDLYRDTTQNVSDSLIVDSLLNVAGTCTTVQPTNRPDNDCGLILQSTSVDVNEGLFQTGNPASGVGELDALLADIAQFLPKDGESVLPMAFNQIGQSEAPTCQPLQSNLVDITQEDRGTPEFIGPFAKQTKDAHLYIHVCPECGKTFDRPSNLERHARTHSGETPFKCDEPGCAKAFKQRSALTIHRRRHNNERPFACEFPDCDMRFSESSGLARHRRAHTGRRPWRCEQPDCVMSFTRQTGLAVHMKTHATTEATNLAKTMHPGADHHNPKPPTIKKRKPRKKADSVAKTAAEIDAEKALVEEGYQLWSRARQDDSTSRPLRSDIPRVMPRSSTPLLTTRIDQPAPPVPLSPDEQGNRESGLDLNAAPVSLPVNGAESSGSHSLRPPGRKRKRPPSRTESTIMIDEHEEEIHTASRSTTHSSVQQATPTARRKRGRPRKVRPAEAKASSHTLLPNLVPRNSMVPPARRESEPPRAPVPNASRPAHEQDGSDETEEEEEVWQEREKEKHRENEEGERSGSIPITEEPSPNSVPSPARAGNTESIAREEQGGPGREKQSWAPRSSSQRSNKQPNRNGDESVRPKKLRQSPGPSKVHRSRQSAGVIQSSRGSTPSTARLARTIRAKKRQLTARPSFFVDASKPQVPSYSDDDEIYTEDEEEEEEEGEHGHVAELRQPNSKSPELEAWAMDESVQDWIS